MDDTCTALNVDEIDAFHEHLNSIEPSKQFTREVEKNGSLLFLDVQLRRDGDGPMFTSVYR